jgi:hypothetical protein
MAAALVAHKPLAAITTDDIAAAGAAAEATALHSVVQSALGGGARPAVA